MEVPETSPYVAAMKYVEAKCAEKVFLVREIYIEFSVSLGTTRFESQREIDGDKTILIISLRGDKKLAELFGEHVSKLANIIVSGTRVIIRPHQGI